MSDVIDEDAGTIIGSGETIPSVGQRLMRALVDTASGQYITKAERLGQADFIPWRRDLSF